MSEKNAILQSLRHVITGDSKKHIIEMRSQHVISSVLYLMEAIESHYDPETADLLNKKLISAIKSKKPERFSNYLKTKDGQ